MRRPRTPKPETVKRRSPAIRLEASAKVATTAKYEVKKAVHEVIPPDVTRAKAGAWLTLISPITQWAGLRGDQLAHKRALLRLQQEETLAEIANRARARLRDIPAEREPVPMKFIVPFLEKASLENADSELVELWANLLVSAAHHYNPHYIHFVTIISQMSAQQARVFTNILRTDDASRLDDVMFDLHSEYFHNFMQEHFTRELKTLSYEPPDLGSMWKFAGQVLDIAGVEIKHVEIEDLIEEEDHIDNISTSNYTDDLETDFEILAAIGLIRYVDTGYFNLTKRWKVKVMFYYVTPLGREFAKVCGILTWPQMES